MSRTEARSAADAAEDTLATLEAALRAGDLRALGALEAEIEAATAALEQTGAPAAAMVRLRHRARRLAAMLAAAQAGIGAARHRLHDVARAKEGLGTYDRAGTRKVLPAAPAQGTSART